jgi:hypothetical protein
MLDSTRPDHEPIFLCRHLGPVSCDNSRVDVAQLAAGGGQVPAGLQGRSLLGPEEPAHPLGILSYCDNKLPGESQPPREQKTRVRIPPDFRDNSNAVVHYCMCLLEKYVMRGPQKYF